MYFSKIENSKYRVRYRKVIFFFIKSDFYFYMNKNNMYNLKKEVNIKWNSFAFKHCQRKI